MNSGKPITVSTSSITSEKDQRYDCTARVGKSCPSMHLETTTTRLAMLEIISSENRVLPTGIFTAKK